MIFLSILILIVAIALPSINKNIRTILYVVISSIIFIYAGALAFNAFYIQSIGSGIGIYSGVLFAFISQYFNSEIFNYGSFSTIILLYKLILACFWFSVGVFSDLYCLPVSLKLKINEVSFIKLTLIFYLIFWTIESIEVLVSLNFPNLMINPLDLNSYFGIEGHTPSASEPQSNTNTTSTTPTPSSANTGRGGKSLIVAAGLAGGMKLAQGAPTPAAKAGAIATGLVVGGIGVAGVNIVEYLTEDIWKKNFLISEITELSHILQDLFNLTGNNGLDLLIIIHHSQRVQIMISSVILYYFILNSIEDKTIENIICKLFPIKIGHYIMKSITIIKKSSRFLIFFLLIILIISNTLSYFYLDFFIVNIKDIVEICFK